MAKGHILLESVPGLAKTLAASTLASALQTSFARVRCTPDLLPSDIIGSQVFDSRTASFERLHQFRDVAAGALQSRGRAVPVLGRHRRRAVQHDDDVGVDPGCLAAGLTRVSVVNGMSTRAMLSNVTTAKRAPVE